MATNDNTKMVIDDVPLNLPEDKEELYQAVKGIKEGLNKANANGVLDLRRAFMLGRAMKLLAAIISDVSKSCYSGSKDKKFDVNLPNKIVLKTVVDNVTSAIQDANLRGTYSTVDESEQLCECLMIITDLINGIIALMEKAEQNKKTEKINELKETV